MPKELLSKELILADVQNLEDQVRLFLYEYYILPEKKESFPSVLNLVAIVSPLKYQVKQLLEMDRNLFKSNDERNYEKYAVFFMPQLLTIVNEFRLFSPKDLRLGVNRINQVWYSIYKVFKGLEEWTDFDLAIWSIEEIEGFYDKDFAE